ncbi:MAG: T9SS type A sorting domain-containing protein [Bacteroidia bacterium]
MKTVATLFLVFFVTLADAQSVQWARKGGGSATDQGKNISVDALGNSYVVGNFQNTVTFGSYTLIGQAVATNTFFAKYDALGNIQWLQQISGGQNAPGAVAYSAAQNCIYVVGKFFGTISLGAATLTTYGNNDCFFARYDLNGNCVWAVKAGSINGDWVDDVDCDPSGNLIATGIAQTGAIFGSFVMPSHPLSQTFTTSVSPSGNFQWLTISCYTLGSGAAAPYPSVKTDAASNIYITGLYNSTCVFGSQTFTALGLSSNNNIFLQMLSPSGNILWTISIGGTSGSESTAIATDLSGNVYLTGDFFGTADFGGISKTSLGGLDIFVAKYRNTGSLTWVQQFGSTFNEVGKSVELFPNGNIVVAGYFNTALSFGSYNITGSGNNDGYVSLLNTSGIPYWAQAFGGTLSDQFGCAVPDANMNIYCTGYFNGTAFYGGIPLTTSGNIDASIIKIVPPTPLPVQLITFTATPDSKNEKVNCKWTTASETNNNFFTLEKSADGKTFQTLAQISATNTSSYHNYNFIDENPFNGISYYRLSQTDFNGSPQMLKTVSVNLKNKNNFSVECYPSFGNGELTLNSNKTISEIKVFDVTGNMIRDISNITSNSFLNLTDLKNGIYFIESLSESENEISNKKIIINH